jgi:hypothetical protein
MITAAADPSASLPGADKPFPRSRISWRPSIKLASLRRRLLNLLTGLSLLLCVAVVAQWVRSYFASDRIEWRPLTERPEGFRWGHFRFSTTTGVLYVAAFRHELVRSRMRESEYDVYLTEMRSNARQRRGWVVRKAAAFEPTSPGLLSRLGFGGSILNDSRPEARSIGFVAIAPCWFLLLLFAALPSLRLLTQVRSWRSRRRGLCPSCGYDLRATPGRCPECGQAAPTASLTH